MTSRSDRPFWKEHLDSGEQLVVVEGYTWRWPAGQPDLHVGDWVVLPGNIWTEGHSYRGQVTAIGSDYLGPTNQIIDRCLDVWFPTFDEVAKLPVRRKE